MLRNIRPNWEVLKRNFYYPYRHFDSDSLGIPSPCKDRDSVVYTSYSDLPVDLYMGYNDPPKRLRRYSRCIVDVRDLDNFKIYKKSHEAFKQRVSDKRGQTRYFDPIEDRVISNKYMTDLIGQTSALSYLYHGYMGEGGCLMKEIHVDVHQVRQMVYPGGCSSNSPEGIHRDGADCIVSAFVFDRRNIDGGDTIIYDENKSQIFKTTLKPGLGMFQEDRKLYHHVTDIVSKPPMVGYRDILGLDFTYIFENLTAT